VAKAINLGMEEGPCRLGRCWIKIVRLALGEIRTLEFARQVDACANSHRLRLLAGGTEQSSGGSGGHTLLRSRHFRFWCAPPGRDMQAAITIVAVGILRALCAADRHVGTVRPETI